ncbi:MAG TPA: DUF542 domain-containing protein [Gemmatimonadaceae bacterium]
MPTAELDLDCRSTVNSIVTNHPETAAVFNRFGLDTCCGASLTVEEAAQRDGVDTRVLCTELRAAAQAHSQA